MDHLAPRAGARARRMIRRAYVRCTRLRRTVQPNQRNRGKTGSVRCSPIATGGRSVKKQTLILVLIGAILFVAGSVIAYASVRGASKNANNGANAVAST